MSSLAGEEQQQELWQPVINKQTNQPYKTIWNCASIQRFDKEEPTLSKKLSEAFTEWYKDDKNKQLLKWDSNNREGCGFKFVDGEFEYKLLEFTKDGKSWRTLGKRKVSKGGGGYSSKPFTLMRTVHTQKARLEQVAEIINTQGENDNWKITFMYKDEQGEIFLLEKQESYVPQATQKSDSNSGSQEASTEESQ